MWPNVLENVKAKRRVTWMLLLDQSDVIGVDEKQLQIGLQKSGSLKAFTQSGHDEIVRQALIDVVGLDLMVVAVLDPSVSGSAPTSVPAAPAPTKMAAPAPAAAEARAAAAAVDGPVVGKERSTDVGDDEVALDDADADDDGLAGPELIAQQLGGTVIGEIDHA
jgi:DNA polymerase-3 subunit gamma/tau